MTSGHEGDRPSREDGLQALGALGTLVDCSGPRLNLEGPQVLWLVAEGALDLFAVDAVGQGHWYHLGRLEAGSLLLGPVAGPQHTLVARPLRNCVVRRIQLRELYQPVTEQTWVHDGYGSPRPLDPHHGAPEPGPLEHALALGMGRGLSVLFQAPMAAVFTAEFTEGFSSEPGFQQAAEHLARKADEDVFWMDVPPGSVAHGAVYGAEAAADLLVDPALWQGMVDRQFRLLSTLDRWIDQQERSHESRAAAGVRAG
ncbi:NHLP bacteriocin export ABC transporter permease/ATPase subunit, partial [Streptomyces sp. UH6]|nr:NHLP bacteriocin export ABC transporter permease/ATPase subunit [Streptomyces sp. UH6]